jgi:hypothetical protein
MAMLDQLLAMMSGQGADPRAAMFSGQADAELLPPSTNDPQSREPVVFSGGVPQPRPRPTTPNTPAAVPSADASGATDLSSASAPLSMAPSASPKSEGGGISAALSGLLSPQNAPMFLALAGGLAGAPSLGIGMRRAFAGAAPAAMQLQQNQQKQGYINDTYQALVKRGLPDEVARAAATNPEMLKQLLPSIMGGKKLMNVNGVLVDEATGKQVADFSDAQKWQIAKVGDPNTGIETSVLVQPATGATRQITPSALEQATAPGGPAQGGPVTQRMALPPEVRNMPPSLQFKNAPDGSTATLAGRPVVRRNGRWEYVQ